MSSSRDAQHEGGPGLGAIGTAGKGPARPGAVARLEAELERRAADADPVTECGTDPLAALIVRIDRELATFRNPSDRPTWTAAGSAEVEQVLRFRLGEELYAVPSGQLIELAPVPELTFVPGVASECGLANFRGEIIAVTDLRPPEALRVSPHRRMIVVAGDENRPPVGVIVDASLGFAAWQRDAEREDAERQSATPPSELTRYQVGLAGGGGLETPVLDLAALIRASDRGHPVEGRP